MIWLPVALLLAAAPDGAAAKPAARPAAAHEVLPFIDDDYPRALAEARRQDRPIFAEAWAPW
jgi:hypothetical protein